MTPSYYFCVSCNNFNVIVQYNGVQSPWWSIVVKMLGFDFFSSKTLVLLVIFSVQQVGETSTTSKVICDEEDVYDADVFCKSNNRLIKIEKSEGIVVVDTYEGNSVLLECKYWYEVRFEYSHEPWVAPTRCLHLYLCTCKQWGERPRSAEDVERTKAHFHGGHHGAGAQCGWQQLSGISFHHERSLSPHKKCATKRCRTVLL